MTEPLLTEAEAAEHVRLAPRTLQVMRYRGGGPEYVRLGHRSVRYSPTALERWVKSKSYHSTAEEPSDQGHA